MHERRRDRLLNKLGFRGGKIEQQRVDNTNSFAGRDSATAEKAADDSTLPQNSASKANARKVSEHDHDDEGDDTNEGLWKRAYSRLCDEMPEVVEDYLRLLAGTGGTPEHATCGELSSVVAVVNKQREIMEKKHWRLVFWHREIVLREKVDRIVQAFSVFEGLGSAVASLNPVHAGIPWAGVCALLQLIRNDSEQHARVVDGLVSITEMMNFYAQAESFYLSQGVNTEPLIELYTLTLEFQMLAAGYFARNTAVRFTRNILMLDSWSEKLSMVQKKDGECRKWVDLSVSKQILGKLDACLSNMEGDAAQAQRVLQWISTVSVRDQHIFVRESKLGRSYWGNGQWLLGHQEFVQWVNSPAGIFYLEGGVGVGKSCLVSAVLEECFKSSLDRLGFFYCSRSTGEAFRSLNILRSILAQLSYTTRLDEIPASIQNRYNSRLNNVDGGSLSLRDCEDHIIELSGGKRPRPITIAIDALDECGDHEILLGSLKRIYAQSSNIHIFFSSRPTHLKVTDYFQPFSTTTITVLDQTKHEMQSFIEAEIRSPDRRRNSCIDKHPELERRFRDELVERAGAMFRWAELQLDIFLSKKKPIRHWKDFESKLNKLISDPSLPTLSQAYDEIYSSNVEPGSFAEACATKALRCVLGAFQPLNIHQLVEAVAVDRDGDRDFSIDASYIMDVCSNFIVVDRAEFIALTHLSVREYLEQKKFEAYDGHNDDDPPVHTYARVESHHQLAEACLATILHADPLADHDASSKRSFLKYAIVFWPSHCEKVPEDRRTNGPLGTLMTSMMSQKLSDWAAPARGIADHYVISDLMSYRLRAMPVENPYTYVVCAWGLVDFFNNSIQCFEPLLDAFDSEITPLEIASFYGHLELVHSMLDTRTAIGSKDVERASTAALKEACSQNHYEVAKLLLATGADPSSAMTSMFAGDFDRIVQLLLDHGAAVDAPALVVTDGEESYDTALDIACAAGHLRIVQVLVRAGAEINRSVESIGTTLSPLHVASALGHEDVVRFLLDHGADVNPGLQAFLSPLMYAAEEGHYGVMRILLEHGADPNPKPSKEVRKGPLHLVLVSTDDLGLVKLLVKSGANVNGTSDAYGAPLRVAISKGQLAIVRFLLDSGADITGREQGSTKASSLVLAARAGYLDIVQLLTERGADLEKYGPQACWEASRHGHTAVVDMLMARGVQMPDTQDEFSITSDGNDSDFNYEHIVFLPIDDDDSYSLSSSEEDFLYNPAI